MTHLTRRSTPSLFGQRGYLPPIQWTTSQAARALAHYLGSVPSPSRTAVVRNPHLSEAWAQDLVQAPTVISRVAGLIGPEAGIDQTFLVTKWPEDRTEVPMHQDGVSVDIELDPVRSVSCWLSISNAPEAAGALQFSVGSHRWGYLPHDFDDSGALAAHDDPRLTDCEFTTVPTTAGEALLFDTRLLHRSGMNSTHRPRIGLNIVYARRSAYLRGSATTREGWQPLRLP
ncbi:phytanoyl-CoA dioxygenase family protein [Nocardia sp. NBC_01503]|uniref:phytanoyl-CoA dioxygenase family protein n=1 Tax=Nocardia sp. NBC_01503 TaxID=2975997 RepID=UPI002E7C567B|nr:phytanoyl-CoA dioxygenase family protein [Nocardia sp. NBC_01503]WTL32758.1 phytanoyl-CoA dioxygenase family protein [Nocardia sp. NBC_01503]